MFLPMQFYNTVLVAVVQLYDKDSLFGPTSSRLERAIEACKAPVVLDERQCAAAKPVRQAEEGAAAPAGRSSAHKPKSQTPFRQLRSI